MITTDMIKSIEIIEKLKLTKKSEVPRSKNQEKLKKRAKNGTPGASPYIYNEKNMIFIN
jgi:hypothetical protein